MKTVTLILLLLTAVLQSYAQSDYRKGFVINNSKDTIHGFIDFNSNKTNSKLCRFKQDIGQKTVKYMPFDIKSYAYSGGRYYQSKKILFEGDSLSVFLECLVVGKLNLYKYSNSFFVSKGDGLYDITEEDIEVEDKFGFRYLTKSKLNRGVLSYYVGDNKRIYKRVEKMLFDHKSLTTLVEEYNCENTNTKKRNKTFNNSLPFIKFQLGVVSGITFSSIDFQSDIKAYDYLTNSSYENIYFSKGLKVNVSYPRVNEHVSLSFDITKQNISYDASLEKNTINYSIYEDVHLEQESYKFNLGLIYHLISYRIRPFISIGAGIIYNSESNNYSIFTKRYYSKVFTENRDDVFSQDRFVYLVFSEVGASYEINNYLTINSFLRYERTPSVGDYEKLKSNSQHLSVMIGLLFQI